MVSGFAAPSVPGFVAVAVLDVASVSAGATSSGATASASPRFFFERKLNSPMGQRASGGRQSAIVTDENWRDGQEKRHQTSRSDALVLLRSDLLVTAR